LDYIVKPRLKKKKIVKLDDMIWDYFDFDFNW
jgi:hypothetical protein